MKITSVKVLGSGCRNCKTLLKNTETALKSMGADIPVDYVTDMEQVMNYGVMSMPALVVNDAVVSAGRVLKPGDVKNLLAAAE